jgi:Domain of unknown function (DUF6265)
MNKSSCLRFVAVLSVLLIARAAAHAAPCTLAGLNWMAANWQNTGDPEGSKEHWSVAPGGILMGTSWEVANNGTGYAEIMSVRQDGAAINMILRHFDIALSRAWEERTAPMIFTASSCGDRSTVFDGQGDHQGEHLTYSRTGKSLLIIGDFLHHGKPDHEEWHMIAEKK